MKNTKWTPGPWQVPHFSRDDISCNCKYIIAEYGGMGSIATIDVCEEMEMPWGDDIGPDPEQAKANGRLISTTPELYDVLEKIVERYHKGESIDGHIGNAGNIMKKARGEEYDLTWT